MIRDHVRPVAGFDYPRTLPKFNERFSTEKTCAEYLSRLRWPEGFRGPAYSRTKDWATARGHMRCVACHRQTSSTAGTVFEGTRKPLRTWFQAMWQLPARSPGAMPWGSNACWGGGSTKRGGMDPQLRRAMVQPERERLSGCVEVDENYVGGEEEGMHGRETYKKTIVVIAVEMCESKGFERIRVKRVPDVSSASLTPFVCQAVQPGSTVHPDDWNGYKDLASTATTGRSP